MGGVRGGGSLVHPHSASHIKGEELRGLNNYIPVATNVALRIKRLITASVLLDILNKSINIYQAALEVTRH